MKTNLVRNPDVGTREESENGALLFNPDTSEIKVVNSTGLFIWTQCDGHHSIDEIVSALQDEFEGALDKDELTSQVETFLDLLASSQFLGQTQE